MNYLGGYYLIKLRPVDFGSKLNTFVYTSSDCINDNLLDTWSYSWTNGTNKETKEAKKNLDLDDGKISEIRQWVDKKNEENKVGWVDLFTELESALEYRQKFFSHLNDIKVFAIYFDEKEAEDLMEEFKPQLENEGEIGLCQTLSKQMVETDTTNEELVGFDLVGVEVGGVFHTFHCHDIGSELSEKFGLTLNSFGLFDDCNDWKPVLDYLNDEKNGCEPVPWFVAKTKLIKQK